MSVEPWILLLSPVPKKAYGLFLISPPPNAIECLDLESMVLVLNAIEFLES